jgi:DNA-binding response OmpR family regulator
MNTNERLHVLYVDDNRDSFEMLKVMLDMSQIEVAPARSMFEALTHASSERFDLYLLDSGLPDGDGVSLCRTLRAAHPEIPVLFYSGNANPEEIKMGMAAGADAYITKPYSEGLAATILQLVTNYRERRVMFTDFRTLEVPAWSHAAQASSMGRL